MDKFEKLKEILLNEYNFVPLNEDIRQVRGVIKRIKDDIGNVDNGIDIKDSIILGMEELKDFEIYDCILTVHKDGAMNGMGYIILDDDFNVIGYVRII